MDIKRKGEINMKTKKINTLEIGDFIYRTPYRGSSVFYILDIESKSTESFLGGCSESGLYITKKDLVCVRIVGKYLADESTVCIDEVLKLNWVI